MCANHQPGQLAVREGYSPIWIDCPVLSASSTTLKEGAESRQVRYSPDIENVEIQIFVTISK
jgi:hypothetical protein